MDPGTLLTRGDLIQPEAMNWIIGGRLLVEFVQLTYIPLLNDSSGIFKSNGISDRFYEE